MLIKCLFVFDVFPSVVRLLGLQQLENNKSLSSALNVCVDTRKVTDRGTIARYFYKLNAIMLTCIFTG